MKTNILITKLKEWSMKTDDGKEMNGVSAHYLTDEYDDQRTTIKDEALEVVKKANLPALFEADVNPVAKKDASGRAVMKYEIRSLKFLNSVKVF
jgi:hypothetical protein